MSYRKMGADDFLVERGDDAFCLLLKRAMTPPCLPRSLDSYRADMEMVKVESVGKPSINIDTSPTGAGKSYSDVAAVLKSGKSLTVVPTHKNSKEVLDCYDKAGIVAAAYPELSAKTCQNYETASKALASGLPASSAVCPSCPFRGECDYHFSMGEVDSSPNRIGTQKRAELSLKRMADGRPFISIHEEPTGLLRPIAETSSGLDKVAACAQDAKDRARELGNMDLYHFYWNMETVALWLLKKLEEAENTTPLDLPEMISPPPLVDAKLFSSMQSLQIFPSAEPMRIVKAVVAGEVEVTVRVDRILATGGKVTVKKSIIAVWQTKLPENATIWLSDATADPKELELLIGRTVEDKTPGGRLEQQHEVLQIPTDVKQSTAPGVIVKLIRTLLLAFPDEQRIGIITHRKHVTTIKGTANGPALDESLRSRISKIEYFHDGDGRGSNKWIDECDRLIVLGTPRVPPTAVKLRLIQTGRIAEAATDGEWREDYWSGVTVTGKRRTVRTSAYRNHDWHQAHRSLVHSELIQSIGRGRGICPNGIPVIVISNENLGLTLLDTDLEPLSESAISALRAIYELTAQNPNIYSLEFCAVSSSSEKQETPLGFCAVNSLQIANCLNLRERRIRYLLNDLLRNKLVEKVGERGGWKLTDAGKEYFFVTPFPSFAAGDAADREDF